MLTPCMLYCTDTYVIKSRVLARVSYLLYMVIDGICTLLPNYQVLAAEKEGRLTV